MHEHVAIRTPGIGENWPELWDKDYWTATAHKKLNALASRGIGTIVDLTTADMGRDLHYVQRVAERTTINVVRNHPPREILSATTQRTVSRRIDASKCDSG